MLTDNKSQAIRHKKYLESKGLHAKIVKITVKGSALAYYEVRKEKK